MDTLEKDVISALSAVLSNSGSWYTSRKSNTLGTSSKRPKKTSSKRKMPEQKEEDGSSTDDSNHKSTEADDVSKRKKNCEKDDESSVASQESENNDEFDEPPLKASRFSYRSTPKHTLNAAGPPSPIIEVDPSLLQENILQLEVDHEGTSLQTVDNDPLISAAGMGYKPLSYGEDFDENYLFQRN